MNDVEVAKVVAHVIDSWPMQQLPTQSPALWRIDFRQCDFECMIQAIDQLRRSEERMATTAKLLETWKAIHAGARHPALPAVDPRDYPESPYLRESKKLIYSEPGRRVLMTPPERLTDEERKVRVAILDCAKRHEFIMLSGGRPNDEMLAEVAALATALEQLPGPSKMPA